MGNGNTIQWAMEIQYNGQWKYNTMGNGNKYK
jgi:hypothetical protein